MPSFPRLEDTPVPNPHVVLEFRSCGDGHLSLSEFRAFLESPREGVPPGVGCSPPPPAAVPDRVPVPAMREQAAHTPVPTLPSHLKANQLRFLREGRGTQAALGVAPADSRVPCCLCVEQGAGLFPRLCL